MRGTSRHYAEPELSREWNWKKQWLVYTGLFVVTALLVFAAFFVYQKTLLKGKGNVDGLMQHYPSYTKLKRVLAQGGEGWSWDVGLGASFFDTFKGKLTNPLTYLLLAFPQKYLDMAYDFVTILRQYLAGVAFLIFGREVKLTTEQNVLGAFAYAFSGWAIIATLTQGTFNNSMMLFPILIMGAERILKGKSPLVFIVAEVLFLASTVLWAYIAGIFVILYFIVRYFHFYGKNGALRTTLPPDQPAWKSFAGHFGGFIGDGLIGLMISAIFVESIIYTTTSAVINSDYDANQGVFYSLKTYFAMPTALVSLNEVHEAYSAVFAGLLVTALMPMIIWTVRKKKSTAGIFAIFCLIIGLFPVTGKILNGFSYSVGRWYFVLTFFLVWAAMECLDHEVLGSRKRMMVLLGWWFFLCVWVVLLCIFYLKMLKHNIAWESLLSLCMMFPLLAALAVRELRVPKSGQRKAKVYRGMTAVITAILVVNVGLNSWIMMTGAGEGGSQRIKTYIDKGAMPELYDQYVQRVVPDIQAEDTSFYRTDQLDDGFEKSNVNIVFGGRSIYEYFSSISSDWLYFNKMLGNNAGYNRRIVSLSNDNRPGMDYLLGVKYFLRDKNYKEAEKPGYVPYGFEYQKTIDGVEAYRNKHCMGIGTGYSQYITESELKKFAPLEREQVMLQAAVVPDREATKVSGLKHAKISELHTDVQSLECSVTSPYNVKLKGVKKGEMTVQKGDDSEEDNYFNIHVPKTWKNMQIVVSFQGLDREPITWDQHIHLKDETVADQGYNRLKEYLYRNDYTGGTSFIITAMKGDRSKTGECYKYGNTGLNDISDYNINLGYYDSFSGDIRIHFDKAGFYKYDAIKVYGIPMESYDQDASVLDENSLKDVSFDDKTVRGMVNNDSDRIMYFSIIDNAGWTAYVDGEKADKISRTNLGFTGIKVPAGKHEITLRYRYPGLRAGIAVTIIGLGLLVVVLRKGKRKNQLEE